MTVRANEKQSFEVLAVSKAGSERAETSQDILKLLSGTTRLWTNSEPKISGKSIKDDRIEIQVIELESPKDINTGAAVYYTFQFTLSFLQDEKENQESKDSIDLRDSLLKWLKDNSYSHRFITRDSLSEKIAKEMYPLLYQVENALRRYLVRFFNTKFGPDHLGTQIAHIQKAKDRAEQHNVFKNVNDKELYMYSCDFEKLGEFIYEENLNTTLDLKKEISKLDKDSPDLNKKIEDLQYELQSDYEKFFKKHFKDTQFKESWRQLTTYRNRIAHSSLFLSGDLEDFRDIAGPLIGTIDNAYEGLAEVKVNEELVAELAKSLGGAVEEARYDPTDYDSPEYLSNKIYASIEDEYPQQRRLGRFIGLAMFKNKFIDRYNAERDNVQDAIEKLIREGKLVLYRVNNPTTPEHPTTAVRPGSAEKDTENEI